MDLDALRDRIDRHSPTWKAVEDFLNHYIKELHEALEVPRENGLERIDQGKLMLCRLLSGAAQPKRPGGERGPESGQDYGLQGY